MEEKGLTPFQAAIEGTREIGLAVLATTLSLIAVFLPVAFMGGIVGRFMNSFGLTMAFAILVSLLVAFTLTPMMASRLALASTASARHGSRESRVLRAASSAATCALLALVDAPPLGRRAGVRRRPALGRAAVHLRRQGLLAEERRGAVRGQPARARGHHRRADRADRHADRAARSSGCRAWPTRSCSSATTSAAPPTSAGLREAGAGRGARRGPSTRSWTRSARRSCRRSPPRSCALSVSQVAASPAAAHRPRRSPTSSPAPTWQARRVLAAADAAALEQTPGVVDVDTTLVLGKPELRVQLDRARPPTSACRWPTWRRTLQIDGRAARRSRPTTRAASSTTSTCAPSRAGARRRRA